MRDGWMRAVCVVMAAVLAAGCTPADPRSGHVEVEDAWVRLPAVTGRPAAAYFHIRTDVAPATLIRVDSPQAARAELHESVAMGGMMSMRRLARVAIPADAAETFAPGGKHVMLFGIAPEVRAGGAMQLRLHFAGDPAPALVDAKVVGPADPKP